MDTHGLALGVTSILVGVVWLAQWRLYPRFTSVPEGQFREHHTRHIWRIVPMTAPLMALELVFFLAWWRGAGWALAGLGPALLLGYIWGNTFLLQVPRHRILGQGGRDEVIARLIRSNRHRALAWTLYWLWLGAGRPWP
jgi:hypothetical protein